MEQNKKQKSGNGLLYAILICAFLSLVCNIFTNVQYERKINDLNEKNNEITATEDTVVLKEPLVDTVYFVDNDSTENVE